MLGVTTIPAATDPAPPHRASGVPSHWRMYLELSKARLCALVVVTALVGFLLGSEPALDWSALVWTLIGTALAAFGANATNQCLEVDHDARMHRTRRRPLPSGQMSLANAWIFASITSLAGPLILLVCVNPLTAMLAALCEVVYIGLYTPMKLFSPLNTLVGAVCGAIPPMMGWTAATGQLGIGAWALAAILFVWQIPHFLALAWMYREDYRRGGYCMLPSLDDRGGLTCRVIILYSLTLIPISLVVTMAGLSGWIYATGAFVLGTGLLLLGVHLARERSDLNARRLFLASVVYLPILLGLMVADRPAAPADPRRVVQHPIQTIGVLADVATPQPLE